MRTALVLITLAMLLSPAPATETWRSALFPESWTPKTTDDEGRYLDDFSYAGYRNGESPLPPGAKDRIFDVRKFGADPTGKSDTAPAIRKAIDAASKGGGVVFLPEGLYRCDDRLVVRASKVVLRGAGPSKTKLHFTKLASRKSHLLLTGKPKSGPDLPLASDAAPRSNELRVADVDGLKVGDDVVVGAVITDAFVAEHGMTKVWRAFNGKWQPFFRRAVTRIDQRASPAVVHLDVPIRYPLKVRDRASLRVVTGLVSEVGVEDLALSDVGDPKAAWGTNQIHVLELNGVKDAWVRNVHSFAGPNSPTEGRDAGAHLVSGGIMVKAAKRVTVASCRMEAPIHRGGGGNGYLFEIRVSSEVLTRDCFARGGRHNFIQNWGFGTSGCVWLRCESRDGKAVNAFAGRAVEIPGYCEFHHSLATANLIDSCTLTVGWSALNRGHWSTGAGHTATRNVFWNTAGGGLIRSSQFGPGFVIGTAPGTRVLSPGDDWVEGEDKGATLAPRSLYEAQLRKRTGREAK